MLSSTRLVVLLVLLTGCGGSAFDVGLLGDSGPDAQGVEASVPDGDAADARGGEDQGEAAGDGSQDTSTLSDGAVDAGLDVVSTADGPEDSSTPHEAEAGAVTYCCDIQGRMPLTCGGGTSWDCLYVAGSSNWAACSNAAPCPVGNACYVNAALPQGTVEPCP